MKQFPQNSHACMIFFSSPQRETTMTTREHGKMRKLMFHFQQQSRGGWGRRGRRAIIAQLRKNSYHSFLGLSPCGVEITEIPSGIIAIFLVGSLVKKLYLHNTCRWNDRRLSLVY